MTLDKLLSQIKSADPRIIEARRWIDEPNPYRVNSDSVDKLVIEFRTTKEVGRGWVDINQLVDALDDEVGEYCIPGAQFKRALPPIDDFDADYLIPILVDDVIPGDTFNVNMSFVARLSTPLYPIMNNIYLETFFFYVPYRLLWDNWEKFCGSQEDPADSIDYTIPVLTGAVSNTGEGTLWDYFGLPWIVTGKRL